MKLFNEKDLLEVEEARNQYMNNVEVLGKVKDLILLPNTEYATTEQVAEYYEVGTEAVNTVVNRHRDELETDGFKLVKKNEIERSVQNEQNIKINKYQGYIELVTDGVSVKIANRGARTFSKRAILRVGMLLRDSEVAKQVRTTLLNIVHDTEQQAPQIIQGVVSEMSEEQELILEKANAEFTGDYDRVSYINAKLFALKNKRITDLENENNHIKTHALTIIESRSVINRIVRTIAMREYGSMFGQAWGELYSKANYILGINVKQRKKKKNESYLNTLTESETFEVEKIVRSWAVEVGLDLDELLKIA